MGKKLLTWGVVGLLVFFLATRPESAAHVTQGGLPTSRMGSESALISRFQSIAKKSATRTRLRERGSEARARRT